LKIKRIVIILTVIILLAVFPILYYYKSSIGFNIERITGTQQGMINKYFHTKLNDESLIKNFVIKKDIEFHYCIEAELAVPENKINEIFAYYDKHKKITVEEMDEDYFRAQMYSKIGVNKDNFDYQYNIFDSVYRKALLGVSETHTQRTSTLIFTKPVDGYVRVYLYIDKLGWKLADKT